MSTVWQQVFEHVFSFVIGLFVGFVLSNRYRIVKRNGKGSE